MIAPSCVFVKDEWTVGGRTLAQLFDRINATVGEHKRERKMRTLVVVDDLQSDIKRVKLGQSFENLVEVGRHDYATVFVLTQGMFKAGGAGPTVRENVAVTLVLDSDNKFHKKVLKCESVSACVQLLCCSCFCC